METTMKQPIVANENGYYPLELFYYVEDEKGYWAKGVTIQEALAKIKKLTRKTPKKYALTTFVVTNPKVFIEDAIKEVEVYHNGISYQTENTQLIANSTLIG